MRSYTLLAVAAPLVLALPAPPQALPFPAIQARQGIVTDPVTGLTFSLGQAAGSLGSVVNAIPAILSDLDSVLDAADLVLDAIQNGTVAGTNVPAVVQKLFRAVKPTAAPTSIPQAMSSAAAAFNLKPGASGPPQSQNLIANALTLLLDGFTNSDMTSIMQGANPYLNVADNSNRAVPASKTFYNTVKGNAPFSVPEPALRAAMYIPDGFTWGKKQPVLLSPGTGATGTINFRSNIGKLLSGTDYAEPVYLEIPGELLSDAQTSAEYVSYALQYLHATTGREPAVVTWSQGSLDTQWAFKYWPSVTKIVTDHIAISPDYHGTVLAYLLCPGFALGNSVVCVPSVIQQDYNSQFVTRLRDNGGDSAYVPTTTVYSLFDEIVEPQDGNAASGFLQDSRNVGVSNTFLQGACAVEPAGLLYTHEGVLYNPVAWALVEDALTHSGPGDFSRVESSCQDIVAPGLSVLDVLETESLIPLAVLNIFSYIPRTIFEPALRSYAKY